MFFSEEHKSGTRPDTGTIVIGLIWIIFAILYFLPLPLFAKGIFMFAMVSSTALYGGLKGGLLASVWFLLVRLAYHLVVPINVEGLIGGFFAALMVAFGMGLTVDIIRRKDRQLKESEEKYRRLFNNTLNGFALHEILLDDNGNPVDYRFLDVNRAFEEQTGLEAKDILGKRVTEVIPGIEETEFIEIYGQVALKGENIRFERYSEPLDSWYRISAFSPQKGQFATVVTNVTESRQARNQLEASKNELDKLNREYELIFNNTQDAMFIIDVEEDGSFRFGRNNLSHQQLTGLNLDDILGRKPDDLLDPETADRVTSNYQRCCQLASVTEYEERLVLPGGQRIWHTVLTPILEEGRVVKILGSSRDITDLKENEREIERQRNLLDSIFNSAPIGIWVMDENRDPLMVNDYYERNTRFPSERPSVTPQEMEECRQSDLMALKKEGPYACEERLTFTDGKQHTLQVIKTRLEDEEGQTVGVLGLGVDITERKEMEQELKQSRSKLNTILNSVPQAIFWKDPQGVYLGCNQVFANHVGFEDSNEVIGKTDHDLPWPAEEREGYMADDLEVMETRKAKRKIIEPLETHDGRRLWISTSKVPLVNEKNEVYGILGVYSDITQRIRMEEELRESEERFRQMAENVNEVFWLRSADNGEMLYISPAYEEVWGRSCQSLYDNPDTFLESVHDDDKLAVFEHFERYIQGGSFNQEYRIVRPDGGIRWVWARSFPVFDDHDKMVRHTGVAVDITRQKRAEKKLQQQLELERIVSEISTHFINAPAEEMEESINYFLQRVSEFMGVDRSYLCLFSEQDSRIDSLYEWCVEGVKEEIELVEGLSFERMTWWQEQIEELQQVHIPDVDQLPEEAAIEKQALKELGLKSVLSFPLFVQGRLAGFIGFGALKEKREWPQEEIAVLQLVMETLASALVRHRAEKKIADYTLDLELQSMELERVNRLLDEEISKAERVHKNTLPNIRPDLDNLDLYAYYQPANRMGGDFYDFISISSELLLFYISDITGHGLDAAMMSAFVKNTIGSYVELMPEDSDPDPEEILDFMFKQYVNEGYPEDYFVTILLGIFDLNKRVLTYSSAGMHVSPLLFYQGQIRELAAGGMPISTAISENELQYHSERVKIPSEAVLFFCSDGLIEQRAGERVYGDGFKGVIKANSYLPPPAIGEEIKKDFSSFTGRMTGDDDITFLIFKTAGIEESPGLNLVLESNLQEVETAKEQMKSFLDNYFADTDKIIMALHELLINAVEHGNQFITGRKVSVHAEIEERYLLVSVEDEGLGFDWRKKAFMTGNDIHNIQNEVSRRGRGLGFLVTTAATDYFYYSCSNTGNRATFIVLR